MPINELIRHLRVLDSQQSWRYSQLPQQITLEVLKQLNDSRLIEVRLRSWFDSGGQGSDAPVPMTWHRGGEWFVVRDYLRVAGTLDEILQHPDFQGECEPEFRVSPAGQGWLLRAEQGSGSQLNHALGHGQGGEPTAPGGRKQRPDAGGKLKSEAKQEIVLGFLDECGGWDGTLKKLSEALKRKKGLTVSGSTLSRYLKGTKYDRHGRPHRAAKGKGQREPMSGENSPADCSDLDAWTMPDDAEDSIS